MKSCKRTGGEDFGALCVHLTGWVGSNDTGRKGPFWFEVGALRRRKGSLDSENRESWGGDEDEDEA